MSESAYLNFFNNEKLIQNKIDTNYGGINKSPLCILVITPKVRLHLIPDTFFLSFVVVPDLTMTYKALLGREFISMPGLTVTFD